MPTALVRRVAANSHDFARTAAGSIALVTGVSIAGSIALWLGIRSVSAFDLPPMSLELVLGTITITLIQTLFLSILNGQHRFGQFAWLSAASAVTVSLVPLPRNC